MNNPAIEIRRAGLSDTEKIALLQANIVLETYKTYIPVEFQEEFREKYHHISQLASVWNKRIVGMISKTESIILIAHDAARVIGVAAGYNDVAGMYLQSLYVDSEYRGHRVGSNLLVAMSTESGARLRLEVLKENVGAIEFYERHGLRVTGAANNTFFGAAKVRMTQVTD